MDDLNTGPGKADAGTTTQEQYNTNDNHYQVVCAALFSDMYTTKAINFINFDELISMAENPVSYPKDKAPCIAGQLSGFKNKDEVLKHDAKRDAMLLCNIDIDDGNLSLDELKGKLVKLVVSRCLIYSTSSSMRYKTDVLKGKCWRVIIPLKTAVNCSDWLLIQEALADLFNGDYKMVQVQQVMYAPNNPEITRPEETRHYEYAVIDGEPLDAESLPDSISDEIKRLRAKIQPAKTALANHKPKKQNNLLAGQLSVIDTFNEQYPIEETLEMRGDVKTTDNKWLYSGSTSGKPGIIVFQDSGKMYSHHGSDSLADGKAHDSFDVFQSMNGLDFNEAIQAAAKMCKAPDGRSLYDYNYAIYLKQPKPKKTGFSFEKISLRGQAKEMEKKMLDDTFIIQDMAIQGQSTAIYAGPNTGKTLFIMKEITAAIAQGNFNGDDLLYINADDTYKGLVQKIKIAEDAGFHMACPGHNGFKSTDLVDMLAEFTEKDTAQGKIIILDTAKKFTNLMDKKIASEFGNVVREFVGKGGSVIMLAHVNKHKGADGLSIAAGTSDIADDADCVYIGDVKVDSDCERVVQWRNTKSRGDVKSVIDFKYNKSQKHYPDLLNSVERVDDSEMHQKIKINARDKFARDNIEIVSAIKDCIEAGQNTRKEIEDYLYMTGTSRRQTKKVLFELTGDNIFNGELWYRSKEFEHGYKYFLNKITPPL